MNTSTKLSIGPVLYYWPRQQMMDFYDWVLESSLDVVYLGETICSKRNQMRIEDWWTLAQRLADSGKQVVLSSLALLEAESELQRLRGICGNDRFLVEANDMAAVQLMQGRGFVAGHSINVYNCRALALLAKAGLKRWVLPLELSLTTLAEMQCCRPPGVETEVFAYGRMPLAYSARCFTARAHNLPKDDCQYRCLDYPEGLTLSTQDDTRFLAINGIQTQSAYTLDLLPELENMVDLGVDVIRISPQARNTEQVVECFRRCLQGSMDSTEGSALLRTLMPVGPCSGYWRGEAGMEA